MSGNLNLIPTDDIRAMRDKQTIDAYNRYQATKQFVDDNTPAVQFFPGFAFVEKRPVDATVADGKTQRTFFNQNQFYGTMAAQTSAKAAFLTGIRPIESRDYDEF